MPTFISNIFDNWNAFWAITGLVASAIVLGLRTIFASKKELEVHKAEVTTLKKGQAETNHRLTTLENALNNLPKQSDLHELCVEFKEMEGSLSAIEKQQTGIQNSLTLITEHLLKQ
ncbi:MAG: DUF2730 family protein [Alphaproteobacteria bacterium]|nr:DUF2730 family protein [Alphaproteobacteria bacterium]MDD9919763.1 DUF2730 family protein [Alphaproteobacteria bacterium]